MESDTGLLMKTIETALQCTLASFSVVDSSLSLQIKLDKSHVFLDLLKSGIPRDDSDVRVKFLEKNIFKNCDKCERVVPKKVSEIHLVIELNDAEARCTECMDNSDVEARRRKIPVKGSQLCPVDSQRKQQLRETNVVEDETNNESDSVLSNEDGTVSNKYFSCPDCGKIFTAIGYLNKHIKRQAISCKERAKNRIDFEKRQDQMKVAEDETINESFSKTMVKVETEHSVSQNPVSKEEEILFHCQQCSVSFKTHYALQRHARGHRDQPFRCPICGKVFKSELYLARHKKVHEHVCKICGKMYGRPLLLSTHMLSHEDSSASKKNFSCKKCGRTFTALAYLRKHLKRQAISCRKDRARGSSTTAGTERRQHSCQVCGSLYVTRAELRKHMDNHTEAERKACGAVSSRIRQKPDDGEILQPQTGKANTDKRGASLEDDEDVNVAGHPVNDSAGTSKEILEKCEDLELRVMKLEPNHSDSEDQKKTSTAEVSGEKDSGGKHENPEVNCQDGEDEQYNEPDGGKAKKSNEKKEYRCHFCNVSFSNRRSFNYHSRIIHAAVLTESSFLCHICGMAFSSQENVDKHVQAKCAFSETEKQRCTVCNRVLTNSVALERHMLVHNGNRSIMCELCGKCFLHERSLKAHLAGHADHRPHKCDICGRRFRNIWHMKVHRKTHTGENLFQCPDCKDWFVNGSYLNNQHKRKYCKWRSKCSCDVCGRELQDHKHLESHMGYHSGERPYMCEKCGKAFTKIANRDEHYNRHFDKLRFNCEHCNRGFKRQTDLRKHIKRHNGDQLQLRKYILPQHLKPKDVPQDVIITEQELDQATILITEEPISGGMQISGEDIKLETPDVGTPVLTTLPSVLSSGHVTVTIPSSLTTNPGEEITVVLPRELADCSQNISITESGDVLMVAMGPDVET